MEDTSPQKERLHELLKDGDWHSNIEILNNLHIWRVSARIHDLRTKDRVSIETKRGEGSYYYYRLKPPAGQLTIYG